VARCAARSRQRRILRLRPSVWSQPDRAAAHAAVPDPRSVTLDEFDEYLRTVNNRDGRPYEEATIHAYVYPAKALTRG